MLLRSRRSLVDPGSRFSEPFRLLRLTVEARNGNRSSNVLVFTSPGLGQGKSTVAANYAVSLAGSGRRTLLVDGDLRRPVLHAVCDVPRSPGLVEVLADDLPLGAAVHAVAGIPGLAVLPAGHATSNAAEFVDSGETGALVAEASSEYDAVVIDTPPVLLAPDASALAARVGADVIVVTDRAARLRTLTRALHELERVRANVLGLVVNRYGRLPEYVY